MPQLYSWGANSHGQLGQGILSEQCAQPTPVTFDRLNKSYIHDPVVKITGGAGHSFIIFQSGHVYGCGLNKSGQLALPKDVEISTKFELITTLENYLITDVACGWDSSIALTQNSIALVWGSNKHLQLGLNDQECFREPQILANSIKLISMGLRHIAIVNNSGLLATAGSNSKAQLCLFDEKGYPVKKSSLKIVSGLENIIKVACGQNHTLVLTADGELFGFGDNRYQQISANTNEATIIKPQKILFCEFIPSESKILCGWTHNALVANDGKAVLWGRNNYGQLATTGSGPVVINDVVSLALGSEHCLSIDSNSILYAWGWNEHNNCGFEDCSQNITTKALLASNCILIGTGYGYSFAILQS